MTHDQSDHACTTQSSLCRSVIGCSTFLLLLSTSIDAIAISLHAKTSYIVKITTWLLRFRGSLNRWVVWLKKSKIQLLSINLLTIPSSFKELAQSDTCLLANILIHMHSSAGYYLVQNQITASRWMHMNCMVYLDDQAVSLLALWSLMDFVGADGWSCYTTHLFSEPWNYALLVTSIM